MRVSSARLAHILIIFLAIAGLVSAGAGRRKKRARTPLGPDELESQDDEDININGPTAAPNADELDELDDDAPMLQETGNVRVRFANASQAEPPAFPSTPESLGRLAFALSQAPENPDLYGRPTTARERKVTQAEDYLERTFHPWFIFSSDDRRKRFYDMLQQLRALLHDLSASTGATFATFIGRPERNPADPTACGEMLLSRSIRRSPELLEAAQGLFEDFLNDIARPRREDFERYAEEASAARRVYKRAQEQYEAALKRARAAQRANHLAEEGSTSEASGQHKKRKIARVTVVAPRAGAAREGEGESSRNPRSRLALQPSLRRTRDRTPPPVTPTQDCEDDDVTPLAKAKGKRRAAGERPGEAQGEVQGARGADTDLHEDAAAGSSAGADTMISKVPSAKAKGKRRASGERPGESNEDEDNDAGSNDDDTGSRTGNVVVRSAAAAQANADPRQPARPMVILSDSEDDEDDKDPLDADGDYAMVSDDEAALLRRVAARSVKTKQKEDEARRLAAGQSSRMRVEDLRHGPPASSSNNPPSGGASGASGPSPSTGRRPQQLYVEVPRLAEVLQQEAIASSSRRVTPNSSVSRRHVTVQRSAQGHSPALPAAAAARPATAAVAAARPPRAPSSNFAAPSADEWQPPTPPLPPAGLTPRSRRAYIALDRAPFTQLPRDESVVPDSLASVSPPPDSTTTTGTGQPDVPDTTLHADIVSALHRMEVPLRFWGEVEMIWYDHPQSSAIINALRNIQADLRLDDAQVRQLALAMVRKKPPT